MATTITKTIGTGGDYATIAAWITAIPANLVTADEVWVGQLLNEEHTTSTGFAISSKTTDATRYIHLTTAPGASFIDNAGVATNPLRVDTTKGATITMTGTAVAFQNNVSFTKFSKIQIRSTNTGTTAQPTLYFNSVGVNGDINQCIVEGYGRNTALKGVLAVKGDGTTNNRVRNTLVVQRSTDTAAVIAILSGKAEAINCTFVATGATLAVGVISGTAAAVMKNVYIGGVTAPEDGTIAATKTTCYCSTSATGYTVAALSTSTFENVTDGTHDFRLKAGSGLLNVGTTDSTYAANDITNTSRPQGASYDVGAYEAPVILPAATLSWTETSDTFSMSGGVAVQATISRTEDNDVSSVSVNITVSSVTVQVTYTEADDTFTVSTNVKMSGTVGWTEADDTCSITGSVITLVTITTAPFKNNTGTVLVNLTSLTVTVLNATTLAFVKNFTNKTTDSSGVMTIPDSTFTSGVQYAVVVCNASGVLGVEKYTAA